MTKQTPEDFLHALIETYDLAPVNEPFQIHLDQINQLANAEGILRSRATEIDALNNIVDQTQAKLDKLEVRYKELEERNRTLSNDLKEARNELLDAREKSEPHEVIRTELNKAEYALLVSVSTVEAIARANILSRAIKRVFMDLKERLTSAYSDIPF